MIEDSNSDTEEIDMTTAFDSRLAVAVDEIDIDSEEDEEEGNEDNEDNVDEVYNVNVEMLDEVEVDVSTNIIVTSNIHENCYRNYEGTIEAIKSDGLLLMLKRMHKKHESNVFIEYVISDDDTTMSQYLKHPRRLPNGTKNSWR